MYIHLIIVYIYIIYIYKEKQLWIEELNLVICGQPFWYQHNLIEVKMFWWHWGIQADREMPWLPWLPRYILAQWQVIQWWYPYIVKQWRYIDRWLFIYIYLHIVLIDGIYWIAGDMQKMVIHLSWYIYQ
jgi:hypothetical protein